MSVVGVAAKLILFSSSSLVSLSSESASITTVVLKLKLRLLLGRWKLQLLRMVESLSQPSKAAVEVSCERRELSKAEDRTLLNDDGKILVIDVFLFGTTMGASITDTFLAGIIMGASMCDIFLVGIAMGASLMQSAGQGCMLAAFAKKF